MADEEEIVIRQKFNFNPSSQLLSELNLCRKENWPCDVTLQVGDTRFKAHRLVLASISPYFEVMFFSGFIESRQDVITLHNIDETTMHHLLEFAYTGSIIIDEMNFKRLLCASHFLQIEEVYEAAVQFLGNNVNLENWFEVLNMAQFYKLDNLRRKASLIAVSNLWHVEEKHIVLEALVRDIMNRKDNVNIYSRKRITISYAAIGKEFITESNDESQVPIDAKFRYRIDENKRTFLKYDSRSFLLFLSTNSALHDQTTASNRISSMQVAVIAGGMENFDPLSLAKSTRAKPSTNQNESQWCFSFIPETSIWFPNGTIPNNAMKSTYQTIAALGTKLYVTNGDFFYEFDSIARVWNSLTSLTHSGQKLELLALNGYIYAIHGGYSTTVERYNPIENGWTFISRSSQPLFNIQAVTYQNKIYVFGHLGDSTRPAHDRLKIYDPHTDSWTETSVIPRPQRRPTLCVLDGFIYLVGGLDDVQNIATARVQCYDVEQDQWNNVPSLINCRCACGTAVLNGKIYTFGGMDQSDVPRNTVRLDELAHRNPVLDSIECYDPATKQWSAAGTLPRPAAKMSCVTMNVPVWMSSFKL